MFQALNRSAPHMLHVHMLQAFLLPCSFAIPLPPHMYPQYAIASPCALNMPLPPHAPRSVSQALDQKKACSCGCAGHTRIGRALF